MERIKRKSEGTEKHYSHGIMQKGSDLSDTKNGFRAKEVFTKWLILYIVRMSVLKVCRAWQNSVKKISNAVNVVHYEP